MKRTNAFLGSQSAVVSTLVCEMNGTVVEFKPVDYSIVTYAKNSLSKASNSAEFKTLLVEMLNYGSMAQIYLNYGTDSLANSTLTEEEKAYASYNAGDDITLETVKSYVPISGETVSFRSVAALFADSVEIKYILRSDD